MAQSDLWFNARTALENHGHTSPEFKAALSACTVDPSEAGWKAAVLAGNPPGGPKALWQDVNDTFQTVENMEWLSKS